MALVDTHAHLDDDRFDGDRDAVIDRAVAAGVVAMLAVGTTLDTSRAALRLAQSHAPVWAAVGIQPNYTHQALPDDWDAVVALARQQRVVALGETGLDRYWKDAPFDVQQDYFDRHLRLSQQVGLPVVVHLRDCEDDVLEMLRGARRRGALRGVMHSYTGSAAGAAECVELGLHVSFAGMVTYRKSDALRRVAAAVPLARLLVETDSPYLAPEPLRGRRNEPAHVVHTAACLAAVRGLSTDELASATTANAQALFGLT